VSEQIKQVKTLNIYNKTVFFIHQKPEPSTNLKLYMKELK